jgi:hypothetical protein
LFTFREAGTQVSPVTMSHPSLRTTAPLCLPLDIKDPLKEDRAGGGLFWAFCFGLFAFWVKGSFWLLGKWKLFDMGGFGREKDC